ncbi:ABC-type nitrate/sulfonate/bicarbonate transport system substrate-binding protein [Streptomyces sp. SAI-135]|jgi:ABC-type nitrate/sulfonate/bicarbonate transport system substrate-binding protein|uniref:ABC transporter substrate-binding protein n=1 Tax=unclassified Streptomyces TaxID=2593676 RepID=UPI002475F7B6|nr:MULTISPECIES: ABC transporter substrate-binding protein [unclassified Streptomyces]MDH6522799.1 ABC-type nitrate/sulfonate/bicarbonate transport system substrate-binding protein [Streptomyces sp. SAI-090]MDH6554420.1 ABC-type nitrate/sulfonate/bicarbonate transport system substrate-binding protein [Streptomyces sp. SAI-041]MDH6573686.1 ABC-type nitrate/sulfonate/bicarbonate transport system substrate-binding protein [Streptomyces sp. SAI-117]MDH6581581.1 ABC-type nitrate/sulfonate/bicarbonat
MTDQLNLPGSTLSRRGLLGLGLSTTVGFALAGCGPSTGTGSGARTGSDLGQLKYAFSWVYDVTQAGPYMADTNGYYKEVGFSSVKFIPGGPSAVSVLTQLANGTAEFGVSSPTEIVAANQNGASFRVIGAMYQKTPSCIVSLQSSPITTPADLKGKTIAVSNADKPAVDAFLAVNGLKSSDMKIVPFQYDPAPLVAGQVDGIMDYSTNSPISLKQAGHDPAVMMFADFKYATITQTYVASTDQISNNRTLLKAALRADVMGWRANIANPKQGASLAVNKYGKSLKYSLENQLACNQAEIVLMRTADTETNGILTVSEALQKETVETLALTGAHTTVDKLFDMSLLAEIYQEHPELKRLS